MDILEAIIAAKIGGGRSGGGSGGGGLSPSDLAGVVVVDPAGEKNEVWVPTMDEFNELAAKVGGKMELVYSGSGNIVTRATDGEQVNFQQIIDYLKVKPDFTYMVCGDRAYLPSLINDDESGMHYIYFESTMVDGGMSKHAVIAITSGDGETISGISMTNVASENYSNKVSEITDRNKASTGSYPSVKAVVDYVEPLKSDMTEFASDGTFTLAVEIHNDGYVNNVQKKITSNEAYGYSDLIHLNKGETLKAKGQSNTPTVVDMLSLWSSDGNKYLSSVYAYTSTDDEEYTYTATEECYVRFCNSANSTCKLNKTAPIISELKKASNMDDYLLIKTTKEIPTFTVNTGYVSSTRQEIVGNPTGRYTSVFNLNKGDKITLKGGATTLGSALSLLSSWSSDGTTFKSSLVNSATDFTETTYTVTDNVSVRMSWLTDDPLTAYVERYEVPDDFKEIVKDITDGEKAYASVSMFEKVGFCGDSYVKGQIYGASGLIGDRPNLAWGSCLGRLNGVESHIYASSGADTNTWQSRSDCMPKLLSDAPCGLYIFCLGINDSSYVPLGTMADMHSDYTTNPNTFFGNYGKIIERIKNYAPNSKIILMPPFYRATSNYYTEHIQAIKDIVNHYGIAMVDTADSELAQSDFFMGGLVGGHPTSVLHGAMAKEITELINKCITDNYDYFKTYSGV